MTQTQNPSPKNQQQDPLEGQPAPTTAKPASPPTGDPAPSPHHSPPIQGTSTSEEKPAKDSVRQLTPAQAWAVNVHNGRHNYMAYDAAMARPKFKDGALGKIMDVSDCGNIRMSAAAIDAGEAPAMIQFLAATFMGVESVVVPMEELKKMRAVVAEYAEHMAGGNVPDAPDNEEE